jgi:RNA polymerase sigma-70 factor (ECF subfamily)
MTDARRAEPPDRGGSSEPRASSASDPSASDAEGVFRAVFREHASSVWRALRRLGVREADVEDVAQEVFVVVHRRLPEFEGRSTLRTWLYGICVRAASDHRRRAHIRREQPSEGLAEERQSAPQLAELERAQARAWLDDALEGLDDDKRAVFVLYEIEELTMPEIAEALGCPLKTAYARLYAARDRVQAVFRRKAGGVS